MVLNYVRSALRNLFKHKAYSAINITGCAAVLIALLTVSFQAVRAALANPVEALRYE